MFRCAKIETHVYMCQDKDTCICTKIKTHVSICLVFHCQKRTAFVTAVTCHLYYSGHLAH